MNYIDSEEKAMAWLTGNVPRDPGVKNDSQIIVRVTPRASPKGGPLVIVSVKHPNASERIRGTGKNLAEATQHVKTLLEVKYGLTV
jgi:hypothetical protein